MRKAIFGLAFLLIGCGSSTDDGYRGQLECFAIYEMMESHAETSPQASERLDLQAADQLKANYKRLLDSARELGKSPEDVVADAHAYMNTIDWSNSHGTEVYIERVMDRCVRTIDH